MRDLVVFAPLPPRRSGIADYTAELLPYLAARARVTVVVAAAADVVARPEATVIDEAGYRRTPALHAAPHLLQLGNSLDHAHVLRAALRRPSVVVLHETVLHHLVEATTLGRGRPQLYAAALAREHGPGGRRLAQLREHGLFSPWQRWLLPLNRAVTEGARGILVHSRAAAGRLPADLVVPVRIVPHHVSPRVAEFDGVTQAAARARLGLPDDGPILLCLGHATPPKRIEAVVGALALLRAGGVPARLVIGGALPGGSPIPAAVERHGLGEAVRITGWLPEDALFLHLRAADLLVSLRFPSAGETSGALMRALGMGLPAVADDFGPAAELPDAVVAKLGFARDPAPSLAALLATLLGDPAGLAARGAAARAHARARHRTEDTAAAMLAAVADWG